MTLDADDLAALAALIARFVRRAIREELEKRFGRDETVKSASESRPLAQDNDAEQDS